MCSVFINCLLYLLFPLGPSGAAAAEPRSRGALMDEYQETLVLAKGEYSTFPNRGARVVHNASGKMVKISDDGRMLHLLGKSFGDASMSIGSKVIRLLVTTTQQKNAAKEFASYLSTRPGLIFLPVHPCHFFTGELLRWTDWLAIRDIAASSQACFRFNVKIADEIKAQINSHIVSQFSRSIWGTPSVISDDPISLEFPESAKTEAASLNKELESWGLTPSFSRNTIDIKPMVRIKIIVAEVNQNIARTMGISWPGAYQAKVVPKPQLNQDWEVELKALESQGKGRVLASPTLLSRSGESADFLAGGEIPLPVASHKTKEVVWKKYGISVQVTPFADQRGHLKIELAAEVSNPDSSFSSEGLPAFKTHRIRSQFNLLEAQTITISGLLREEQSHSRSSLPGLANIPLLGPLFSSQSFLENRTELVILVTPNLIGASSEPSHPMSENPFHDDER
jgi:pilus assembly protein CpaC